jgi:hypothetical protein
MSEVLFAKRQESDLLFLLLHRFRRVFLVRAIRGVQRGRLRQFLLLNRRFGKPIEVLKDLDFFMR